MPRKLGLYLAFFLALVGLAFGQSGTSGSINGKVSDSSGAPIPGVKVTVTGSTLIGEETQTTTESGLYRFPTLPAGDYKVSFEAQGFATQVRENITINAGFAAEINPTMNVASQTQTVEVTSQAPLVDTENSNAQNSISRLQMNNLPNSRDVWSLMGVTPGMNVSTIDVGGSNAGSQPGYTAYGYGTGAGGPPSTYGNQYVTVDGVNTTEARNGTGMYGDYGSLAEFTMSTQGNDASVPTPGVYVASVLKSGGNDLHGTFYFDYENPNFQGHNISPQQLQEGAGTGTRITRYRDANGDIGGKIIKDRLWYYVSLRNQQLGTTTTGFPVNDPGSGPANTTLLQNITEKLSGQINRNHRVTEFLTWGRKNLPYRNESATTYADAVYNQTLLPWAGAVTYDGIISPKFVTQVRIGSWGYNWLTSVYGGPGGAILPRRYETATGDVEGSFPPFRENRRRAQFTPTGSYFLDNFLGTNHQLKFGFNYEREFFGHEEYGPLNGVVQIYTSPTGSPDFTTPSEIGLLNGPTREKDYVTHDGLYITDQFKVTKRVTINAGVRWDYWNAYEPQESVDFSGPFSAFYYQGAALPNGFSIPATAANGIIPARTVLHYPGDIAPRVGVAIDLTGKGRTILKANWGRFYQNMAADFGSSNVNGVQYAGGIFSAGSMNVGTGFLFKWNPPAGAAFNLNQLGANVGGSSAQGATIASGIKDPVLDDAGIFLEHQVTNTLSVRAGFVYRFLHNNWQIVNTALTSNLFTNPLTMTDPGPDGVTGTSDDRSITLLDLPTGAKVPVGQTQIQTPAGNSAQFTNFEFEVNKRMSRRFSILGSYYWTGQHYLTNGVATTPLTAINNYVKDHYWTSHFSGTYQAPWGIAVSPILRMQEGQPIDRTMSFKLPVDGSQTIIVDPFGKYHNQNIYVFDTRLEKQFKFHERFNLGVFFDVFNMFNSNADQSQTTTTGTKSVTLSGTKYTYASFLSPSAVLPPRIFRLGVKFSF